MEFKFKQAKAAFKKLLKKNDVAFKVEKFEDGIDAVATALKKKKGMKKLDKAEVFGQFGLELSAIYKDLDQFEKRTLDMYLTRAISRFEEFPKAKYQKVNHFHLNDVRYLLSNFMNLKNMSQVM